MNNVELMKKISSFLASSTTDVLVKTPNGEYIVPKGNLQEAASLVKNTQVIMTDDFLLNAGLISSIERLKSGKPGKDKGAGSSGQDAAKA